MPAVYDRRTCANSVEAPISVARMPNVDLYGFDIPASETVS